MKIGFYNPYFDSMSGGERYVLTLASHWSLSHDVSLFWDDPAILTESQKRLNIDLRNIHTVENIFNTKNIFKKLAVTRSYDLIFFLTDGSVPTTFARRNILHFQVPFQHITVHPVKLTRFQAIVCNSRFTKDNLDASIKAGAVVIYPPVEPISRTNEIKKNSILSVGRFHPAKKQDVLIEIFLKGLKSGQLKGYELNLAGGLQPPDSDYFESLKTTAKGLPVRFFPNIPFDVLTGLYNEARVYWHAAGFGETQPEHMEHFGITTVEAMSAGCIPVVFNGGGQPEIIQDNLWVTEEECLSKTAEIIKNKELPSKVVNDMIQRSKKFSVDAFTRSFDVLLKKITR